MSNLLLNNQAASPGVPAAGKVSIYADTSAPQPLVRAVNANGQDIALQPPTNASLVAQAIAAATRTYIAGSALAVPVGKLQVGSCFSWALNITKTAAGVAASTYDVAIGTTGTVADTARLSFAKPAGTAAVDEGVVEIMVTIRSIGANGVAVGEFSLIHNLAATGHAAVPCVCVNTVSGAFDTTVAGLVLGVCLTSGAADAITVQMVQSRSWAL